MIRLLIILAALVALAVSPQTAWAGTSTQELSITKSVDKSSPNLLNSCLNGTHFPEVRP
jgi:type VI protein secretion system component Hcp